MTKNQPFLSGFPTQVCGSARRRLQDVIAAKRRDLTESFIATYAMQFSHILPADFLHGLSVSKRIRQYCNVVVFWVWLAQILEANASLSKAVSLVQAWCADRGLPVPGKDTSAYSKGRGRLQMEFLTAVNKRVNSHMEARISPRDTYRGHVVKSIDGSSVALDDTEGNQAEYPQPSTRKPGCGFPVMGIMGVLNHSPGGWEDFANGEQSAHDAPIFHQLLHCFNPGDILCGDRAFGTYELMSTLRGRKVDTLMRLHQSRHRVLDWRNGKRIGKNQRLVTWKKPATQPVGSTMTAEEEVLPDELEVRLIRFYFEDRDGKKRRMVLSTTLLDHLKYDWQELAALYAQRWDIELRLRDVKTTLGMEHLRLMSFKGALDTIVSNTTRYLRRQKHVVKIREIWESTIAMIAEKVVHFRPFRHEPRAQKKRPKNFSYLTKPRAEYREIPHRGKSRSLA